MKKIIVIFILSLFFSLTIYSSENTEKKLKLYKEIEHSKLKLKSIKTEFNNKAKDLLFEDITRLLKIIISDNKSTKEVIETKKIFDKKIKLLKKIIWNENKESLHTSVQCALCKKSGWNYNCSACDGDGWGSTKNYNPKKCKACNGNGIIESEPCSVCKGLGWANSTQDI